MDFIFQKKFQDRIGKPLLLLMLFFITVLYTIPWTIEHATEREYSGIDFHGYWYAGHFVRQGSNSYAAILNDPTPNYWDPKIPGSGNPNNPSGAENSLKLPIYYLDGYVATTHPVAQAMIVVPAMTAPLNLLMGLLSWLSWPVARVTWMILNTLFALSIPWIALRILPKSVSLSLMDKLIFALVFYNFYGLRQSIVVGQQTLICLFLLLLALVFKEKWLLAGLLLGFGISKYSVGLPIFIYFLLSEKYRTILVSLVVQAIGIILIMPLKLGSPINTITAYFKILTVNYSQNGVHLPARFSESSIQGIILLLLVLTVVLLLLVRQFSTLKTRKGMGGMTSLKELNLITLAIFLTTYHRVHDMPFMIFFLLFFIPSLIELKKLSNDRFAPMTMSLAGVLIAILLIYPTITDGAWTAILGDWGTVEAVSSIALILMFALSIWLQIKLFPHPNILQKYQPV